MRSLRASSTTCHFATGAPVHREFRHRNFHHPLDASLKMRGAVFWDKLQISTGKLTGYLRIRKDRACKYRSTLGCVFVQGGFVLFVFFSTPKCGGNDSHDLTC